MEGLLNRAIVGAWFIEQDTPRRTGCWSISIDSKKKLKEVASRATAVGLSYMNWEQISQRDPLPAPVAAGDDVALIVYYPWTTPRYLILFPRSPTSFFKSKQEYEMALRYNQDSKSNTTMPPGTFPVLPPKTCATCHRVAGMKCSGCRIVYYCDTVCQKKDDESHRVGCELIRRKLGTIG